MPTDFSILRDNLKDTSTYFTTANCNPYFDFRNERINIGNKIYQTNCQKMFPAFIKCVVSTSNLTFFSREVIDVTSFLAKNRRLRILRSPLRSFSYRSPIIQTPKQEKKKLRNRMDGQ